MVLIIITVMNFFLIMIYIISANIERFLTKEELEEIRAVTDFDPEDSNKN